MDERLRKELGQEEDKRESIDGGLGARGRGRY